MPTKKSFSQFPIYAAALTPFNPDGSLHEELILLQAAHLARTGVSGVFVAGSTGEGQSLTLDERITLTERWASAAEQHGLRMIVSVGHNCQQDAMRLAEHAAQTTANAIACQAPCFFRPTRLVELIDYLAPIAESAAELDFFYYDIPQLTGVTLPASEFLHVAKPRIPNLTGIKFTNSNLLELQKCVNLDDGAYEVLFGCDEFLLAAISLGAGGAVGSNYNFATPLFRRMLCALSDGQQERARQLQFEVAQIVAVLFEFGLLAATKATMQCFDIDCGPVRPPLANLTPEQLQELRAKLDQLQLLDKVGIEPAGC